jgi:hydrogenase maturation protease
MECCETDNAVWPNVDRGSTSGEDAHVRTLVVGLGNPILTDDGVGIYVARELAQMRPPNVDLAEACVGGLRLLDTLSGYERVILVDAIQTRGGAPGDVYRLHPSDLRVSLHAGSTHDLSLPGALAFGRGIGMTLPDDENLTIIAIEVEDVLTFGEECTPSVRECIPDAIEAVLTELAHSHTAGIADGAEGGQHASH